MLPSTAGMFSILNAEAEIFNLAPRWIVFSAALMFFNCGVVVGLMDSGFNDYRVTWWLSYLHGLAGLSIPLIFMMLFNWVLLAREKSQSFLDYQFLSWRAMKKKKGSNEQSGSEISLIFLH